MQLAYSDVVYIIMQTIACNCFHLLLICRTSPCPRTYFARMLHAIEHNSIMGHCFEQFSHILFVCTVRSPTRCIPSCSSNFQKKRLLNSVDVDWQSSSVLNDAQRNVAEAECNESLWSHCGIMKPASVEFKIFKVDINLKLNPVTANKRLAMQYCDTIQ